jgi:fibronectin-binding autotransporter adhesin
MITSIMRKFVVALVLVCIAPALHAAPIWTGAIDNNWSVAGNWVNNRPPLSSFDQAVIQAGTPIVAVFGTTVAHVRGVDVGGALHVNEGSRLTLCCQFPNGFLSNTSVVRSGGELRAQQSSIINIERLHSLGVGNGGTVNLADGALLANNAFWDGSSNFNNMNLNAGSRLNVMHSASLQNFGRLQNSGIMTFSSAASGANIGAGADLINSGTMHVQSSNGFNNGTRSDFVQQGTLNINAGSQFVNEGGATFSHTGGTLNVTANGTFDMQGGNVTLSGGTTNISTGGRMLAGANSLCLDGGTLNVSDQGTMTVSSNLTQNAGGHVVHNNGQFTNNGAYGLNGGNFTVVAGGAATNNTANFVGNGGSLFVLSGGTLDGTGSYTQNSGSMQIDGTLAQTDVTINGGTVQGVGTLQSNVVNIGGTVGPGNSPGTLTIDGDFTQGAAGTLEIELDLGAHDLLDVVGDAFLDGFLDLQMTSAFIDAAVNGDIFRIMNWASHTGQFVGPTEF